jgi:GTP cyclohydrolase FolE2
MIRLIDITSEHIENGTGGSCTLCPIALALRQEYKTSDVEVKNDGDANLYVDDKLLTIHHNQQSDVQDFIELFDETNGVEENLCMETVKPFTLRIIER